MSSIPDIDPYAVLGVQKDATLPEIKAAHRKLVLKCHPDKIKDESMRSKAQDEFQRVQQAYELLSDETKRAKYNNTVRLAELRREMMERTGTAGGSSPYASRSMPREYRDGRYYEERTPSDPYDEAPFPENSRSSPRKNDEFGTRQRTRAAEEKKKTKSVPVNPTRTTKDTGRTTTKPTHTDRAKYRTKERRREANEKLYEQTYGESDSASDCASDSSAPSIYVRLKRPSEPRRRRESVSQKTRPAESTRRPDWRYEEDYSDGWDKHEKLHSTARDYIRRSKGTVPIEIDSRHRASHSPVRHRGYESADPESSSSRHSGRSKRSSRERVRPETSRPSSHEHLDSYEHQARSYESMNSHMPAAASGRSSSKRPPMPSRSATTYSHTRPKREGSNRSDSVLKNMVSEGARVKARDKYDSGYSSPGTPEMGPGQSPPKTSTRYKVVSDKTTIPETVVIEPSTQAPPHPSPRRSRTYVAPHEERSARAPPKPVRSSTYAYTPETSARYESTRPNDPRLTSNRHFFHEVEQGSRGKEKDHKYVREVAPDRIYSREGYTRHQHYDDPRHPPIGRRQSAYA
ncbi:hypothetical protein BDV25DRAFT_164395 [Aspergillus avenaceus]|uniref:J domain-containing protein n=1 Tax=Aspergillus avenaceus TaxID=36643 RepID=A0A5N6TGT6_ASPAV|nr:hypothetical protein BDV25DRAFT_164395 [Aspergillus avenaceus]